MTKKTDRCSGS